MTDQEKISRFLPFEGDQHKWYKWLRKFMAKAKMLGYNKALIQDLSTSTDDKEIAMNEKAYFNLQMSCMDDVSFACIDEAEDNSFDAWNNLLRKYEPATGAQRIQTKREFHGSTLNKSQDPDEWMVELE